jgi:hypothetical protein
MKDVVEELELRESWRRWNDKCHHEDRITWEDYYDEHKK